MSLASSAHLKLTERFIAERPIDITVMRRTEVATPAGGTRREAPVPLPAQTVRMVEPLRTQSRTERLDENGRVVVPTRVVIGMPDMDIERFDTFTAYGSEWKVVHISELPEWRKSVEVTGG